MAEMRYSNQKNTAPVLSSMKNKKLPVPHSYFDLSRPVSFDAGIGWIIPFDCIETLPDSDYEISYDILAITRNPLLRRLLTGMNIYIHTYAEDFKDMWEGFPAFVSRGRSGRITKTVPKTSTLVSADANYLASHVYSPSAYLGVPPRCSQPHYCTMQTDRILQRYHLDSSDLSTYGLNPTIEFSALPLVMYQQLCTYNYLPSNLLQDNTNFFPENERHFVLSSDLDGSSGIVSNLNYDSTIAVGTPAINDYIKVVPDSSQLVYLDTMRVRQFQGDRFNTGLPFPELVRGDVPAIDLGEAILDNAVVASGQIVADNVGVYINQYSASTPLPATATGIANTDAQGVRLFALDTALDGEGTDNQRRGVVVGNDYPDAPTTTAYLRNNQDLAVSGTATVQSSVTLSQLNALKVLTLMRQRAALSDGSYNELIKAQYNTSPALHVGKPFYVGGTKQPLIFNEVVQTSESSASSPLGATGSRAVSAGNGYIGKYHSKDFGLIMSVLMIVPDVTLSQGVDKMFTRFNQSDFHFPLMENLSPEPILNKELFVSGTASTDDDVFAYAERCSEYKSRPAVVRGGLADSNNLDLQAYIVKRHFSTTPSLSYGFTGMFPSNVDYSVFSNSIDTPFVLSINSRVKATLPLSYVTMPNDGLTAI